MLSPAPVSRAAASPRRFTFRVSLILPTAVVAHNCCRFHRLPVELSSSPTQTPLRYPENLARILVTTFGSYGDIHPYMAIGIELQQRGHTVTIATSPSYAAKITSEGLNFHPVRPDVSLEDKALLAYVMDARRGSERVLRYIAAAVRESYEDTLPAARQADLILTHPITFAGVMAAEKLGLPWISSVLAPISFLSAWDPPVPSPSPWIVKARALSPGLMRWICSSPNTARSGGSSR